jgi:hypothetical protein
MIKFFFLVIIILVPAYFIGMNFVSEKYLCEERNDELFYFEYNRLNKDAKITDYNGNLISTTKLERLGDHSYRGPNKWKGNPSMMGIDMVLVYKTISGEFQSFYGGCRKL